MNRPRVLVIRSGANPFLRVGESETVEVVEHSSHEIRPVAPPVGSVAGPANLCAFTSQVAVERVARDAELRASILEATRGGRIAAVGSATEGALRARGIEPDLVAGGSVEDLLEALPRRLDGWTVLLPCGEDAAAELPEELHARGAHVSRIVVYRKAPLPRPAGLEREIRDGAYAAFCTTSPAAARWLFDGLDPDAAERLKQTPAVVLGRFTRRSLEAHGVERIAVAPEPRFESALKLLEQLASDSNAA
jgi:uroporphyrinogen III methyltransferase/synthase